MAKIKEVRSRQILNGTGEPTLETTVILSDGRFGTASTPIALSPGMYEAMSLKGDDIKKAIDNIKNIISPAIVNMEATKQQEVDKKMIEMDGTANKGKLGANTILSVSIAVAKAAAQSSLLPLFLYLRDYIKKETLVLKTPTPIFSMISGKSESGPDFEDFLIIPPTYKTYADSLSMANKIFKALKEKRADIASNENALNALKESIETCNIRPGFDVFLGLDLCADNFYKDGKYKIKDNTSGLSSNDLSKYYQDIIKRFSIIYIEDPFSSDDFDSWAQLSALLSSQTLVVGDNLTATNPYRLQMGLEKKAITGIAIKPLQIGTVIESLAVVEIARTSGLKVIVSGRSQETNDDFIADFATAVSADYVRFGSISRGEMVAKYNRLSEIDSQIKTLS